MSVATRSLKDFRAATTPETPERVVCDLPVSARAATKAVDIWLIWNVGTAVMSRAPRLQIVGDKHLWEVPLYVALPRHDAVGPFHWIRVDAITGDLLIAENEVDAIRAKSTPIIYEISPGTREWMEKINRLRAEREAKRKQEAG
jgi:hypothetical protein